MRLSHPGKSSAVRTGIDVKARYLIAVDHHDTMSDMPVWGVFDMRSVTRDDPHPGAWSIRDPIKLFTALTSDAAVVWAMTKVEG